MRPLPQFISSIALPFDTPSEIRQSIHMYRILFIPMLALLFAGCAGKAPDTPAQELESMYSQMSLPAPDPTPACERTFSDPAACDNKRAAQLMLLRIKTLLITGHTDRTAPILQCLHHAAQTCPDAVEIQAHAARAAAGIAAAHARAGNWTEAETTRTVLEHYLPNLQHHRPTQHDAAAALKEVSELYEDNLVETYLRPVRQRLLDIARRTAHDAEIQRITNKVALCVLENSLRNENDGAVEASFALIQKAALYHPKDWRLQNDLGWALLLRIGKQDAGKRQEHYTMLQKTAQSLDNDREIELLYMLATVFMLVDAEVSDNPDAVQTYLHTLETLKQSRPNDMLFQLVYEKGLKFSKVEADFRRYEEEQQSQESP